MASTDFILLELRLGSPLIGTLSLLSGTNSLYENITARVTVLLLYSCASSVSVNGLRCSAVWYTVRQLGSYFCSANACSSISNKFNSAKEGKPYVIQTFLARLGVSGCSSTNGCFRLSLVAGVHFPAFENVDKSAHCQPHAFF